MTRPRYLLARLAKAFGISFKSRHAGNAATELHLLRDAEEILGRLCWSDLEDVEDLSVEYWNLRRLTKNHRELSDKIDQVNNSLQQSHDERSGLMEQVTESTKDLVASREELVEQSSQLNVDRDVIVREARLVKRKHEGLKAKLEVLGVEGAVDGPLLTKTNEELSALKKHFGTLRVRRDALTTRIEESDAGIARLDGDIEGRRKGLREEALGSFQSIGQANRDISSSRANIGAIQKEMAGLFFEIGHYLSINANQGEMRPITRKHRSLINQMAALRTSITRNNILADRHNPG